MAHYHVLCAVHVQYTGEVHTNLIDVQQIKLHIPNNCKDREPDTCSSSFSACTLDSSSTFS